MGRYWVRDDVQYFLMNSSVLQYGPFFIIRAGQDMEALD